MPKPYLQRCLQLAALGQTAAEPNPNVGSVIVHEGNIIGEGYHTQLGAPHAEVEAIRSVKDPSLLSSSTIYVSLEPCSHFGKTPPCADLIIKHQIPRVIIGCLDPNPKVAGSGVRKLQAAGIEVEMAEDPLPFKWFLRKFFVNQLLKRPYISLKWAETPEGYIAGKDQTGNPTQVAITGKESKSFTHKLRAFHQAILIGRNTAQIDNPQLTARKFPGRHPLRLVFDREAQLGKDLQIFQDGYPSLILTDQTTPQTEKVRYINPTDWELPALLTQLYQKENIGSILVEGGARVLNDFID
ncbi:MAG: bifunctional diaminohydroxyphosphoribosylaminopyrimidine deaminase/5-amino-6-(5-phosphoribosylamino)uracil reductase RibD, partial [Bacteroidota bacterium]